MSTDNSNLTPDNNVAPSIVYGATVGVLDTMKATAIEVIVGAVDASQQSAMRAQLTEALGNGKLGGIAGVGLSVYEDGTVGFTTTGVSTLAGMGAGIVVGAGILAIAPAAAAIATVASVAAGAYVAVDGERLLDVAFDEKDLLKRIIESATDDIGQAIHDGYFGAMDAAEAASNAMDSLQQKIDLFLDQMTQQAFDAIDALTNPINDLMDTLFANPDLNLPAWMNDLADWYNDAVSTPDPILTLRNIGMRGGDPLILDLNGDGVELVQLADSTARFDVNGDDFATPTGWVNAEDGLLVLDKNSNGRIDSVNELFGNQTITGFEELALSPNYLEIPFFKAA